MAKDSCLSKNPVKQRTMQISLIFFGLLLILIAFLGDSIIILFGGAPIEQVVYGVIGLFAVGITLVEQGVKFSQLKKLDSLPKLTIATLIVSVVVVVSSLLNIFMINNPFGFFTKGVIAVIGVIIILEAFF